MLRCCLQRPVQSQLRQSLSAGKSFQIFTRRATSILVSTLSTSRGFSADSSPKKLSMDGYDARQRGEESGKTRALVLYIGVSLQFCTARTVLQNEIWPVRLRSDIRLLQDEALITWGSIFLMIQASAKFGSSSLRLPVSAELYS
jgi:hypothetical protein